MARLADTSPLTHTDSTTDNELTDQTTFFVLSKGIQWTKVHCQEAVQAYEEHCRQTGATPTGAGYQYWQKERDDMPIFKTLLKFVDARQWTRNQCIAAVRAFEDHRKRTDDSLERLSYRQWKKMHPEAPSEYTIARYLGGSWSAARRLVSTIDDT